MNIILPIILCFQIVVERLAREALEEAASICIAEGLAEYPLEAISALPDGTISKSLCRDGLGDIPEHRYSASSANTYHDVVQARHVVCRAALHHIGISESDLRRGALCDPASKSTIRISRA